MWITSMRHMRQKNKRLRKLDNCRRKRNYIFVQWIKLNKISNQINQPWNNIHFSSYQIIIFYDPEKVDDFWAMFYGNRYMYIRKLFAFEGVHFKSSTKPILCEDRPLRGMSFYRMLYATRIYTRRNHFSVAFAGASASYNSSRQREYTLETHFARYN